MRSRWFSLISLELGRIAQECNEEFNGGIAQSRMKPARFAHAVKKSAFFQGFLRFCPCVIEMRSLYSQTARVFSLKNRGFLLRLASIVRGG
jgi:hypothetical protein